MVTFGSSPADDHIGFSMCRATFLPQKNSELTPGVCPPSSFVDLRGKERLRNSFCPPDSVQAQY